MPLSNDKDKTWTGWLVDGMGGREKEVHEAIAEGLKARNMPKTEIRAGGGLNMWWRKDTLFIDVTSDMDGKFVATIHVQEYGASLFVGRAAESYKLTNYYKRMAATAFLESVDRTIRAAIDSFSPSATILLTDAGQS